MRVAFVFNHAQIVGGGEIGFVELVRCAADEPDLDPLVLVPGPGEVTALLERHGIAWRPMPLPGLRGAGLLLWPWRSHLHVGPVLRRAGVDLIHANGARCMLYAGLAGRTLGIPAVWHVRVLERDRMLDRIRALLATVIVANSRAAADSLDLRGAARNKVTVIYNGVDLSAFQQAEPADMHAEFGIPAGRRVVLCVGRLMREKGQQDLVEAVGLLPPPERARMHVVFVGREPGSGEEFTRALRARAAALGVGAHLSWAGQRSDVPRLMRGSDLLVLPSHGETFGRVVVEAWAAGVPVLACATGGVAEIVDPADTGWLVPAARPDALASALGTLLQDDALRARLARAGRRRAADFTVERHAQAMFALYRRVLSKGGEPGSGRLP